LFEQTYQLLLSEPLDLQGVTEPGFGQLELAGLVEPFGKKVGTSAPSYRLTETGTQFVVRLLLETGTPEAKAIKFKPEPE
jgi:hypothetical protein